ncbi:hypothetical protein ACINWC323_2565 [Acinetobacter sp. WC-323]|uniref:hypothetical protein n=1 Tax=Acinetobacter sp. WC-323 TaxID=903918 RepID=UPI00029EB452|nr:hypothetical protein [Acinetobacter sp. WC-323]EKU56614.1 hypothetical protein ACINWC323_2565 [Acinetobacter sp. WC-323]
MRKLLVLVASTFFASALSAQEIIQPLLITGMKMFMDVLSSGKSKPIEKMELQEA